MKELKHIAVIMNKKGKDLPEEADTVQQEYKTPERYHVRYLNAAHIKHYVKERTGLRIGADFLESLDRKVQRLLDASFKGFNRYTQRKTLKAEDLLK